MKINGYLNKVVITKDKYQKTFKNKENLENETLVYKKLNIPFTVFNNVLKRESFKGKSVFKWDENIKEKLIHEIEKFHILDKSGFKVFDWFRYIKNKDVLSNEDFRLFERIVKRLEPELVPSHNDINSHNLLWDGKDIRLIDFEWASLNHYYFDYINLFIFEGIILLKDKDEKLWNDLLFITLCFFLMWAEEHNQSKYIRSLKKRFNKLLKEIKEKIK